MSDLELLEQTVKETYNTEFRLNFNGSIWKLYIVKSRTLFEGTFDEVIKLAIEEFLSYRKLSKTKFIKNNKQFTY